MIINSCDVKRHEKLVCVNARTITNNVSFGHINLSGLKKESETCFSPLKKKIVSFGLKLKNTILNGLEYVFLRGHFDKNKFKYIKEYADKFKNTPEGIRRSNTTAEEIEAKVSELFEKSCEELQIPEHQRPNLYINERKSLCIGGYNPFSHKIEFNPYFYKTGLIDIESTIMHEVTHARDALLRAGVEKERVEEIISNQLLKTENECEKVPVSFLRFIKTPKIPEDMKNDFSDFAKENLHKHSNFISSFLQDESSNRKETLLSFTESKFLIIPRFLFKLRFMLDDLIDYILPDKFKYTKKMLEIKNKLYDMIKSHKEFLSQYKNEKEAYKSLVDYSLSQLNRFNEYTETKLKKGLFFTKEIVVDKPKGDKLKKAEQSVANSVELRDGNQIIGNRSDFFSTLYYFFGKEEIEAETNGNNFLIKNLVKNYYEMKAQGTLTEEKEKYIKLTIKKANIEIAIREKGREYLELYQQFLQDGKYNDKLEQCIREYQNLKIQEEQVKIEISEL